MDRDALVRRNRALTEAYHHKALKHQIRQQMMNLLGFLPVPDHRHPQNRILLIRPDHLGDLLLTTPALHWLRQTNPSLEIHMLVGTWSADVLLENPDVDQVITFPFPGFTKSEKASAQAPYVQLLSAARMIRRIGYTSAVILRPDHWWGALLAKLAGISRRIGYDLPETRRFLNETVTLVNEHAALQNARLVAHAAERAMPAATDLALQMFVSDAERQWVTSYLAERGIDQNKPLIIIHPGSGAASKLWNDADWAWVGSTLAEQLEGTLLFTGGDAEAPLIHRIQALMQPPGYSLAGDTNVHTLAALYERATIVLGPDSGPLHIAAAMKTPSVALFGPADPIEFGPWGNPARHAVVTSTIGCRPCRILDWRGDAPENHPCVREIQPSAVLEAAWRVMKAE